MLRRRWSIKVQHGKTHVFFQIFSRIQIVNYVPTYKVTRAAYRRNSQSHIRRATKFGEVITADHKVFKEEGESRSNHRYVNVVQDLATHRILGYPCKTQTFARNSKEITKIQHHEKPKVVYTDSSLEFGKGCADLQWNHSTSLPRRRGNTWNCRQSSKKSQRRHFVNCFTIRTR